MGIETKKLIVTYVEDSSTKYSDLNINDGDLGVVPL